MDDVSEACCVVAEDRDLDADVSVITIVQKFGLVGHDVFFYVFT